MSNSDDHTSAPPPNPDGQNSPSSKRAWWKRWWGITLIVFALFILIGALAGDPQTDTDPVATDDVAEDSSSPSDTSDSEEPVAAEEPADPESEEPEPEPEPEGVGDGTHTVGEDVDPGVYRSTGSSTCYWARLSGFGGELDDIITNGNNAPQIVEIAADDVGFESQGCGDWVDVATTLPATPATEFGDGAYQVGGHIAPGTYRADGDSDFCYWARLSDFSGELDGVISNGNSSTTIEIKDGDAGFEAWGCGTWTSRG